MLEEKFKSPWRKVVVAGSRTVREVYAAAGGFPVTIGYAAGTAFAPGFSRLGGMTAAVPSWSASAVAAAKIEQRAGRLWAILAKGSATGLPAPGPVTTTLSYGFDTNPGGVGGGTPWTRAFRRIVQNPFTVPARVDLRAIVDDVLFLDGRPVLYLNQGNLNSGNPITFTVAAGGSFTLWCDSTGGFVGYLAYVTLTPLGDDSAAFAARNAAQAIPPLDGSAALLYGNTVAWWPAGEAFARAGVWMRQRSWTDDAKRIRLDASGGTSRAAGIIIDSTWPVAVAMTAADFTAAQYDGTDWESYGLLPADTFLDVTDFRFEALAGGAGFYFAVDPVAESSPDDHTAAPAPPVDPLTPLAPDPATAGGVGFVYRRADGSEVLVPGRTCSGGIWSP